MMLPLNIALSIVGFILLALVRAESTDIISFDPAVEERDLGSDIVGWVTQEIENGWNYLFKAVETQVVKLLKHSDGLIAQFSMQHDTAPPIRVSLVHSGVESQVTVGLFCDNCDYTQPSAFAFAKGNYSNWDHSWLGIALESFDAHVEVDVELMANAHSSLNISLYKFRTGVDGVDVEVDFQLLLTAQATALVSFCAGLNLSLIQPAGIMMPALNPLVNLTKSELIGFDSNNFKLDRIFNASVPKLDFNAELSLRTIISISFETVDVGLLYLDLPAYKLDVKNIQDATSKCAPATANTPSIERYKDLIHLKGEFVAELSYKALNHSGSIHQWHIHDGIDDCLAFFPGTAHVGDVPSSPQAASLTAAPLNTCTTSDHSTAGTAAVGAALRSLNVGEKAGFAFGVILVTALIAGLAFWAGRASKTHKFKPRKNEKFSAWTIPSRRSASKFFSRRSKTEFSPVTLSTPSWHNNTYEGAAVPRVDMDPYQQTTYQDWEMMKKEPVVDVTEMQSPAPTYLSMGDERGLSPVWETQHMEGGLTPRSPAVEMTQVNTPVRQTARYEAVGDDEMRRSNPAPAPAPIPQPGPIPQPTRYEPARHSTAQYEAVREYETRRSNPIPTITPTPQPGPTPQQPRYEPARRSTATATATARYETYRAPYPEYVNYQQPPTNNTQAAQRDRRGYEAEQGLLGGNENSSPPQTQIRRKEVPRTYMG